MNTGAMAGGNAAEHNGFFSPFLIALAAGATYSAIVGDGDPLQGLAIIGQGNDPLSQAMQSAVANGVELSTEHFPEQTLAALGLLEAAGETANLIVTYVDDMSGNVVSTNWNALDQNLRDQIVGGITVASFVIPAGSVSKLQSLKTVQAAHMGNSADFWKLPPLERRKAIEIYVAQTEYKDWFNVGNTNSGFFPLVDFQHGNTLVSLKTVDTNGTGWLGQMATHIEDLDRRRGMIDGRPAQMQLDLRVPPGGMASAQQLLQVGIQNNVRVNIREF